MGTKLEGGGEGINKRLIRYNGVGERVWEG